MSISRPSEDEIQRVAAYWAQVKNIACQHINGFTFGASLSNDHRMACTDCDQPINFLSDAQLDEYRTRRMDGDVRDSLIAQLRRNGVRFTTPDGMVHEVRLDAHCPDCTPMHNSFCSHKNEYACMSAENVVLLLQATEAP